MNDKKGFWGDLIAAVFYWNRGNAGCDRKCVWSV